MIVVPAWLSIILVPLAFTPMFWIIVKFILKIEFNSEIGKQLMKQQGLLTIIIESCIIILDVFKSNIIPYAILFLPMCGAFFLMFIMGNKKTLEEQKKIAILAEGVSTNSQEITATSEQISSSAQEVEVKAREIAKSSENIMKLNEILENISTQINLLSINATIEAGRLGPEGRGFMAVVSQLQKLHSDTKEQIKTSSIETGKIIEMIIEFQKLAEEISAATEEQTASMEEISCTLEDLSTKTRR